MKRIMSLGLALLMVLGVLSACAKQPKPEDTLVAFLEDMKSENETEYLDYFNSEVVYFEEDEDPEENPLMNQEVEDRLIELGMQFTYIIKGIEKNKDGDIALITVDLVTFNMRSIMDDFVEALMAKAMEMSEAGATEEDIMAIVAPTLFEAMVDAKVDKHVSVDVRMTYDAENKRWWIVGGETNVDFVDALSGGSISAMKYYQDLFPAE